MVEEGTAEHVRLIDDRNVVGSEQGRIRRPRYRAFPCAGQEPGDELPVGRERSGIDPTIDAAVRGRHDERVAILREGQQSIELHVTTDTGSER